MTHSDTKQWQLTALTEALGNLELKIEDKLTVGRGQDNDVVLGSKQVSRQHAELTVVNDQLSVQDLGSSNGTLVNDEKLVPHEPKVLKDADVITFAAFSFRVNQVQNVQPVTAVPVVDKAEPAKSEPEAIKTETIKPEAEVVRPETETVTPEVITSEPLVSESIESKPVVSEPVAADTPKPTTDSVEHKHKTLSEENAIAEQTKNNAEAVERADIDGLSEAELDEKLKEELEGPISFGDPNQHESVNSKKEHFEELAAEADPEVHKSKQAAAAQMSATTNLHENIEETKAVEPNVEKSAPVTTEAPITTHKVEETKTVDTSNNSFNTVNEPQQHNVAHVSNSEPAPNKVNSGKNTTFLWMALILVGLAVALWLYNSGTLG
ncbi:FHA domain-containing protein [uncultured Psychrobacter sp.]|uniref:FHA domain-containing protein n=1 Tax=uncultured Psychrobacter sp. TaxID=259303 RepID=UPI002593724C|nr:FHA domain-containing protein [uncultured Psychrobacter sp.]